MVARCSSGKVLGLHVAGARIGCSFIHSGSAYALRPMDGRLSIWRTWTSLQYCLEVETRAGAVHVATCPCAMGRGRCIKYSVSESVATAVAEAEASADLHNSRSRIRGRGAATLGGCRRSAICPLLLLIHVLRTRRFIYHGSIIRSYVSSCHMYTRVRMCMYSKIKTSDSPQHTGQCAISHAPCTLPHALHHSRHAPPPCSKGAGTTTRRPSSYR